MGVRAVARYRTRLIHWVAYSSGVSASRKGCGGERCAENLRAIAELSTSTRLEQRTKHLSTPKRLWLQPAVVSPLLEVPLNIPRPGYVGTLEPPERADDFQIQDKAGTVGMRAAGQLAAQVRDSVGILVRPGVKTDEIDKAAHKAITDGGAYPSLLGFGSFPKEGDIVNIDVRVYLNGYHAETSETFICGRVDKDVKKFVEVARDCLDTAVAICGPGVDYREIGAVITDIADGCNYHVVEHVVGHGLGSVFHSAPPIYHHYNYKAGSMVVGQTFTIAPTLSVKSVKAMQWDDQWTTVTADDSLAAQFKHSLVITESGAEVLTPNGREHLNSIEPVRSNQTRL